MSEIVNNLAMLMGAKPLDPIETERSAQALYTDKLQNRLLAMGGEQQMKEQAQKEAFMKGLVGNAVQGGMKLPQGDLYQQYGGYLAQKSVEQETMNRNMTEFTQYLPTVDMAIKEHINGNNTEGLANLAKNLGESPNPFMKKLAGYIQNIKVTGGGEADFTVTPQMMKESPGLMKDFMDKAATPEIRQALSMIPPTMSVEVKQKKGKVVGVKPVQTPDEKNKTEEQLANIVANPQKYSKEEVQEARNTLDEIVRIREARAKAGAKGRVIIKLRYGGGAGGKGGHGGKVAGGFDTWSDEEKEFWYESVTKGNPPKFTGIKALRDQLAFQRGFARWASQRRYSAGDVADMIKSQKAYQSALSKAEYRQATLQGAVENVKRQVDKFKHLKPAGMQTNMLGLNTLGNKFLMTVVGSVDKAKLDTIFTELSTEIAKIASDSTGSVQQVAEGARQKWETIHNTNYKYKDALELINFIKQLADIRVESGETVLKGIHSKIRGDKTSEVKFPKTVNYFKTGLSSGWKVDAMIRQVRKANPKMTPDEVYNAFEQAKGGM